MVLEGSRMTGYPTGVPVVSGNSGAWPAATITPGRIFGLDFGSDPDKCVLTVWKDGIIIDSGRVEDFDPETGERRP